MGLDVYVGPLTRYYRGEWSTVGERPPVADPESVLDVVLQWQAQLGEGLDCAVAWAERPDLPYWSDHPDWDGYGAMLLLAAYDEHPELIPPGRRRFGRPLPPDDPRRFASAPAFVASSKRPYRYPLLLSDVEWWLPIFDGPGVFVTERPDGKAIRVGRLDLLVAELTVLAQRSDAFAGADPEQVRRAGAPEDGELTGTGRFGLATFLLLATRALDHRQPLLLDY